MSLVAGETHLTRAAEKGGPFSPRARHLDAVVRTHPDACISQSNRAAKRDVGLILGRRPFGIEGATPDSGSSRCLAVSRTRRLL